MKISSLFLLLFTSLIIAACGSDDVTSRISIDGKSYHVGDAHLNITTINGEGHAAISFSSLPEDGMTKLLNIGFEYSQNSPVSGNYSYPQVGSDRHLLENIITHYAEIREGNSQATYLESGKITVKDNGNDDYTLTMDLIMLDGTVVTGKYRGVFTVTVQDS